MLLYQAPTQIHRRPNMYFMIFPKDKYYRMVFNSCYCSCPILFNAYNKFFCELNLQVISPKVVVAMSILSDNL